MAAHPNVVLATPSWSLNGPNVFSGNLVRGLNRLGIPAHIVLTRPDWVEKKPLPRPAGVPFETLPVNRFSSLALRWQTMIRYLEKLAPCFYIPNYDFGHSCVSPQLPDSVFVVGIVHSDDPQHYEHARRMGKYWNAIVAVSASLAARTLQIAPELSSRLSVVPYGVTAAAAFPRRSSLSERPLRVIYAGRLEQAQKRVLDLPEIVRGAAELGVRICMTIAGSGPLEIALRHRFKAIGAEVEFLGTLSSDALATVLAQQDVFLLASSLEGLPIAVLEAMGQGCIPLVSDTKGGVRELIDHGRNGFRIAVGDVQGFAIRLAILFHDAGIRRRVAEAAYLTARSPACGMDRMVRSYVELFAKVQRDVGQAAFHRPVGQTQPPEDLPWQEYLPGAVQRLGHYARRLAAIAGS